MKRLSAALCAAGLGACSSAEIIGGAVIAPGAGPSAPPLASWTTTNCRDAFHRPFALAEATVRVSRGIDGRLLVIESRAGYDDVLVSNSHVPEPADEQTTEKTRVFQVSVNSGSGPRILREYRLPETGNGPGRFAMVSDVFDWNDTGNQAFRATYRVASIACDLVQKPPSGIARAEPEPVAKSDGGVDRDAMVPPP